MIRDLGPYLPRRPQKLDAPLMTMLLNGTHDRHQGRVFVLQIGAGDGETGLPLLSRLRDDGWSGLLVEPHPARFAALDALHADSERVAVLNLGISDVSGNLALHALQPEAAQRLQRAPGRASLIRDRIATPDTRPEDIETTEVPFLRLDTVLRELGIESAQLVVVNAGGHEVQVLRSVDLATLDPSVVLVASTPGTAADAMLIQALTEAGLLPYRIGGWLSGLSPGRLAVPLEELLAFFRKGLNDGAEAEE